MSASWGRTIPTRPVGGVPVTSQEILYDHIQYAMPLLVRNGALGSTSRLTWLDIVVLLLQWVGRASFYSRFLDILNPSSWCWVWQCFSDASNNPFSAVDGRTLTDPPFRNLAWF